MIKVQKSKLIKIIRYDEILPIILKDSSNRQGFFQLSKKILPTVKDSSNRARKKKFATTTDDRQRQTDENAVQYPRL